MTAAITEVAQVVPPASKPAEKGKSHPFFTQRTALNSFHAQQVFDRGFDVFANAIFSLSVILRVIGTEEQALEIEKVVDGRLDALHDDFRGEIARLEKLADGSGIELAGINYSNPKTVDVRITSPRAARYIGLIREFDKIVSGLDTLWLSGVVADSNYSRGIYDLKRRVLRLAGSVRSMTVRAMAQAHRKDKAGSDAATASVADKSEILAAVDSPEADLEADEATSIVAD